jgi:uncharacterized protein (DUF1800 family)
MTTREKCAHLLRKFGLGASLSELDAAEKMGVKGTIDWLIDYEKTPPKEKIEPWPFAYDKPGEPNMDPSRFAAWWALQMATTERPLEENLTLFWHNHFAVSGSKVTYGPMMVGYLDTLRENASGNFRALLGEISRDPAMIRWLDTDTNIKGRPNENFAREVMELFTLGVGNYTEKDIQEVTRAFTGWSLRNALPDANKISQHLQLKMALADDRPIIVFSDSPSLRDKGPKKVFGTTGSYDADGILDLLVAHPAHPKFLMKKLWSYFVYPDPDPKLVDQLAKVYVQNKHEIKPVLRWMANSKEFWSEKAQRAVVKSPMHYTVSIIRQTGLGARMRSAGVIDIEGTEPMGDKKIGDFSRGIAQIMRRQGMYLLYPPDVSGWDWGAAWISTASVIERNKIGQYLFTNASGLLPAICDAINAKAAADSAAAVNVFVDMFDVPAKPDARQIMAQALDAAGGVKALAKPNTAAKPVQALMRLASSIPEFQMI